uniref:Reverse transcriptase domain-containing protein n=1 Tax=Tanacetum cinerariifolium TaxID=118510 RepID=A0A6L2KDG7_TANCI|nr:reverse transcriptase domain-containing protein [Tanacetum cinerariifolium]
MADNRTMEKMLQAPTEGYGDAIVVSNILAENFEIKTCLLSMIQANQFHGFESNNPHDHIRSFNRITSTLKFRDVPNDAINLMLFLYSLEGAAKIWRPFMRIGRALIDVYGEELTLHVDDEAITFKVGQTSKYSYNDVESINRIDVIDVACEEYVQEVLGFFDNSKCDSPTPTSDPIISSSSPSFTPFKGSDFILEEIETFLRTPDELSNLDDDYYDKEGDILYIEKLLNEDPSSNLPSVKTGDLKQVDATMTKHSIEKPQELDLKGINFMGPFPSSKGNKYILVAVDYLSKWVEVKALPTNDARVVVKFLKSLLARFGTPRAIISDRGTHFCNDQFVKVMLKYGVTHCLFTAYHLQTSGQVEVSNRGFKHILERTIGENCASWSDKLDDALWAFRIAFKTPIECTPYKFSQGSSKPVRPDRSPLLKFSLMEPLSYLKPTNPTSRIAPDLEASRARGFVHHPLELQSLAYGNSIS